MTTALTKEELTQLAVPAPLPPAPLSRAAKLEAWAKLLDQYGGPPIFIFHRLEYDRAAWRVTAHPNSAFSIAYQDAALREAGLRSPTVLAGKEFFELSDDELHEFSCDCSGYIPKAAMANRIRSIANRSLAARAGRAALGLMLSPVVAPIAAVGIGIAISTAAAFI